MKWMTSIDRPIKVPEIHEGGRYVALGSCFASHIHNYFSEHKINGICNPYGIVYDPLSIKRQLQWMLGNTENLSEHCLEKDGYQVHLDFHSDCNRSSRKELEENLSIQKAHFKKYLKQVQFAIITLGSAWVFKYLKTERHIANCHGLAAKQFRKEITPYSRVLDSLTTIITLLHSVSPDLQIVFTVSPVRHIRYGLVDNNRSKALLLSAVHDIIGTQDNLYYFPAYEILIDELRDYRYYSRDLVHPSAEAVDYVVEYWKKSSFSEELMKRTEEIEYLRRLLNHKPRFPKSITYKKHLDKIKECLLSMEKKYRDVDFAQEQLELKNLVTKSK